ncbi:MAG: SpoIIE family protein phosphatase [Verrucomicrobiota bacterium]
MKILVAEDDRLTRTKIESYLIEWGHEPVMVSNGAEAWKILQNEDFPLILSDWQMPEMDGLELLVHLRGQRNPPGGFRYAILLTSRSDKADLVRGMDAGADDFITKPFDKDELRVRIRAGERTVRLERELDAKNASLKISNDRMRKTLEAATKVQSSFLPTHDLDPRVKYAFHYLPCEELAGDMLNVVPLDDNFVGAYLIDVSGHGAAAALLSVQVSRELTARDAELLRGGKTGPITSPAAVAAELNARFPWDPSTQQYFTFLYGILDLRTGHFVYTSAGHPGPILASGETTKIQTANPPAIGIVPKAEYEERELQLVPGDRVHLYSDGLFEIQNEQGEEFGEDRLAKTFADQRSESLEDAVERTIYLAGDWTREHLDDDVSLLSLEYVGA